jgi:MEMO1 family protein
MQKRYLIILLFISILFSSFIFLKRQKGVEKYFSSSITNAPIIESDQFFDKYLFFEGVRFQEKNTSEFPHIIKGGIIPHHQVPSFIQADFFYKLSFQNPETIFIIGPNHFEKGGKILTSKNTWNTPFGLVSTNTNIITKLITENIAFDYPSILSNDHSIATLIPYIKYYLPQCMIVPIILSHNMNLSEVNILSDFISEESKNSNSVIIASVDFSHNLTSEKADENDELTLETIKTHEYEKLFKLDNAFLDSPPSIVTLLQTMKNTGNLKSDILQHTNSGKISGNYWNDATSYFSIVYYEN